MNASLIEASLSAPASSPARLAFPSRLGDQLILRAVLADDLGPQPFAALSWPRPSRSWADAATARLPLSPTSAERAEEEEEQIPFEEAEGLAILASCKQGQLSHEWHNNERSVFTHYLLKALTDEADRDKKGFITVQDASRHVTNGIKLWASQHNVSQTPTLQYTVAGDIILARHSR